MSVPESELARIALVRDMAANPIAYYVPRPTALKFHLGTEHQVKFLFGGKRASKSYSVVAHVVMAITGIESIYCKGALKRTRKPPLHVRHWCEDLKRVVEGVLLPIYMRLIPPDMLDITNGMDGYNRERNELRLKNGSVVQFMSYTMPDMKGESASLDIVAFDEPPTEILFDSQYARIADRGGTMIGAMTLDERRASHSIQWIDRRIRRRETPSGQVATWINWWRIPTWENIERLIADAPTPEVAASITQAYENWKASLTDEERRVCLEGYGGYLTGLVYPDFDEQIHAAYNLLGPEDFGDLARKGYGEIRCGLDYGMDHPTAMVWLYVHKKPAIPELQLAEGDCIVYREYKRRGLKAVDNAEHMKALASRKGVEPVRLVLGDPSMWERVGTQGPGVGQLFVKALKPWPVRPANNDKKSGHERVREYLAERKGWPNWPKLRLLKGYCRQLVTELYEYHYVPVSSRTGKSPDETNELNDDLADTLRYVAMSLPSAPRQHVRLTPTVVHPITGVPLHNYVALSPSV